MSEFKTIARLSDIPASQPYGAAIGDLKLVLLRDGDEIHAYQGECPHAKAPLEKGAVCDGALICPFHKARFAIADGKLLDPPALSPLTRYATRIAGDDVLVDPTPLPPLSPTTVSIGAERHFVIVGAGTAALTAAQMLREEGFAGQITMIGPEHTLPYDRTALSKVILGGDKPVDELPLLKPAEFFKEDRIERITLAVSKLDAADRRITLETGVEIRYDRALIATGATPKTPPIQGAGLSNVLTLRTPNDAAAILGNIDGKPDVAIIGGGFIALEAATSLRKQGVEVTIIGNSPIPMSKRFGEPVGKGLRSLLEEKGVRFVTGEARAIMDEDGKVTGVLLEQGGSVPASLVLLATGVTPVTDFVSGVARTEDGGIIVDERLRAAPDLFAAGDVAAAPLVATGERRRIEHWRVAEQHGRLAARNMLEQDAVLDLVPFFWTAVAGNRFEYLGHAEDWDEYVLDGDPAKLDFVAFAVKDKVVHAAIASGRDTQTARLLPRLNGNLTVAQARAIMQGDTQP